MTQAYPKLAGLAWEMVFDCHAGAPDLRSAAVLAHVAEVVKQYGGQVTTQGPWPHRGAAVSTVQRKGWRPLSVRSAPV